jgi:hypothetical protein
MGGGGGLHPELPISNLIPHGTPSR